VHLRNDDPFETSNIIGQLQDGDVVTVSGELGPAPFFWAKLEQVSLFFFWFGKKLTFCFSLLDIAFLAQVSLLFFFFFFFG
jgi:hypothetical protein